MEQNNPKMKLLKFLGDSLRIIREFPDEVRQHAGYELNEIQCGRPPSDFKPMPGIGRGVEELRIWDASGTFRVVYTARLADAIYVLHAFQKRTQATSRHDIELAKSRLDQLLRSLK